MDFSAFVGLPWQDRGRGPGYDCWGLFAAVFFAGTGTVLPSYADGYASAADRREIDMLFQGELGDWGRVERGSERPFDGVAMRIAGNLHVGIVVKRGRMLHQPFGKPSVIDRLDRFDRSILGIYRHRTLA